ncbi:unnamed protein product, partial [marine sediment metagenome]
MDTGVLASVDDVTICCFWWGSKWANEQGAIYVQKLYNMVQRCVSIPHRFVCFTNQSRNKFCSGIELAPLRAPFWRRNLPKLNVYKSGTIITGRVLLLDLDIVILKNIDDFIITPGK